MDEYIQWMIDWMEDRIKGEFSLKDLANYMGYSPYYCSFKFHQTTGMTIRRYILLRRLYLSTEDLLENRKMVDIAMDYGYSSQEAYSRAFKSAFGVSPKEFQLHPKPVQSAVKLTMRRGDDRMNVHREDQVKNLRKSKQELFDRDVLNILNGQMMYEEFKKKKLMGNSDYAPFNEAMCVHHTTTPIFGDDFIQIRATGHGDSEKNYREMVIKPLSHLFEKDYYYIVLWFGDDVFCQMNLLTLLAYLEQSRYEGKVFLNCFREDEFQVSQTEITLGNYEKIYKEVLINRQKPTQQLIPVMYQATNLFLEMQRENNPVTKYIEKHQHLSTPELLQELFELFPTLGYGDMQYLELIEKYK